ncbi:MAG: glucuronate isomerase [Acidobacteriota bacterium]|nr:glucuronate isomerase [Acidobacteriota bacterium]
MSELNPDQIRAAVEDELRNTLFIDVHTHLFMPSLGKLGLWGIDELLTYHYLEAELFRSSTIKPATYWTLGKKEQADLIWRTLFVENPPVSEATRGIVAVLSAFGLDTRATDLRGSRAFFEKQELRSHIHNVFKLAGISEAVMTNDPLDPEEASEWERGAEPDPQFHSVLRLDRILNKWSGHWQAMAANGYRVQEDLGAATISEVRRFLADWSKRMKPVYMACSLPDTFEYPEDSVRGKLLTEAVVPACREFNIPLSLMIGVRYQVNPAIRLAGDAVGKANLRALEHVCAAFPENRFLVSVLSRENQHELCVYARKFANLMPFGCWWFLNNPSVVEEITRERIEMIGTTFIPQHSDARVLEQVIYKWRNTRRTMAPIFANTYRLLAEDGRTVTRADIKQDIHRMFRTNFERWVNPQQ